MSSPATPTVPGSPDYLAALQAALPMLEGIASLFVPGGAAVVAGLTLVQLFNIVNGLINGTPSAIAFVDTLKNWIAGGPAPTAAQWALLDQNFDTADQNLAAADAAILHPST